MTAFQVVVDLDEAYTKQRVIASLSKIPDCTILSVHESFDTNIPVLYWQEYERIPWDLVIKSRDNAMVCANSFCIRKALIRKAQQSYMIQKFVAKRPESILKTSYPETFIVELDHPDYFDEFLNEIYEVEADLRDNEAKEDADKTLFIMKASLTNRGSGIFLFNSVEQLEDIITRIYDETSESDDSCLSLVREWIIQRYIGNPLLVIGGKKFHLRAYVVAVGNLKVYLFDQILALFAQKAYTHDIDDIMSHLTNTCIQQDSLDFNELESVRLFWELSDFGISQENLNHIFEQMKLIVGELFKASFGEITGFQPLPNCFEIFGLDFLVDSNMNVHYLEANSYPDFKQTGERLSKIVIDRLFDSVVQLAVLPILAGNQQETNDPKQSCMHKVYSRTDNI